MAKKKKAKKGEACPDCGKKNVKDLSRHKPHCKGAVISAERNEARGGHIVEAQSSEALDVEAQAGDMVPGELVMPDVVPTPELKKEEVKTPAVVARPEYDEGDRERLVVSKAFHRTLANLAEYAMDDEIEIDDEQIQALSTMGAKLLKKHDKDNFFGTHGIEVAYIITLTDLTSAIYLELRRKRRAEQKAKQKEQATITKAEGEA